jgi:hypothetical protein
MLRHGIDVSELYADALATMPESQDGQPLLLVRQVCPVTLEEQLGED